MSHSANIYYSLQCARHSNRCCKEHKGEYGTTLTLFKNASEYVDMVLKWSTSSSFFFFLNQWCNAFIFWNLWLETKNQLLYHILIIQLVNKCCVCSNYIKYFIISKILILNKWVVKLVSKLQAVKKYKYFEDKRAD